MLLSVLLLVIAYNFTGYKSIWHCKHAHAFKNTILKFQFQCLCQKRKQEKKNHNASCEHACVLCICGGMPFSLQSKFLYTATYELLSAKIKHKIFQFQLVCDKVMQLKMFQIPKWHMQQYSKLCITHQCNIRIDWTYSNKLVFCISIYLPNYVIKNSKIGLQNEPVIENHS